MSAAAVRVRSPRATRATPRWSAIVLACALYAAAMVDRFIPALLAAGLMRDLGIGPVQFGLLLGTSFGLLFALVAFPVAYVVDRHNRASVVAIGVTLWSVATIACGFAQDFPQILMARAGVAIGEAVLMPATMSLIGDLFPGGRRTRPTAVFSGTGMVMGSGLFLIGGAAVACAALVAPALGMAAWRVTFLIVGVPPLLLGFAWMAIVREPERRDGGMAATMRRDDTALRYLLDHGTLFFPLLTAAGMASLTSFSLIGWVPTILVHAHGMTVPTAAALLGVVGVLPCLAGAATSPLLSLYVQRRGYNGGVLAVFATYFAIAAVALALTISSTTSGIVLAGFAGTTFGLAGCNVLPLIIVQWIVPPRICGRFTAITHFASAIGLSIGPPAVALVATRFVGDAQAPAASLALVVATALGVALAMLALAARPFARHYVASAALRTEAMPTGSEADGSRAGGSR